MNGNSIDEKLLIIHMDDMGMGYAANEAGKQLFRKGIVTSASIMMPCSWALEFVKWHRENPQYDVGIHITHTCEWDTARWRPLSDEKDVPGLLDEDGFMWRGFKKEIAAVPAQQVELETKRQYELALKWGMKPTHFDNHMWTLAGTAEFFRMYLDTARESDVIAHIPEWSLWDDERKSIVREYGMPVVKGISSGEGMDYQTKKASFFESLKNVQPGLNVLTLHPVIDTPEIRAVIPEWENRYNEYQLFMDDDTAKALKDAGIHLVSWGEVYRNR